MNSIHYVVILNNNGVQMAKKDMTKAALVSLNKLLQEENETLKKQLQELEKKQVPVPAVVEKIDGSFSWKQHFSPEQSAWIEKNVQVDIVGNYWRFKMPSKVASSKVQKFLSAAGIRSYSTIEYNTNYLKFLK